MSNRYRIEYDGERLTFWDPVRAEPRFHRVSKTEFQTFKDWAQEYEQALKSLDSWNRLLDLGREIFAWLDQVSSGWLQEILRYARPPLLLEFQVPLHPQKKVRSKTHRFLNVPWELLADNSGFLAGHDKIKLLPIRRLGAASEPSPPSSYRFSMVFMAAEPHGVPHLDYEGEEQAILTAVEKIGLDMAVEESGTLTELANRVREFEPDALHLSCHGLDEPEPVLALETDEGELDSVTPERLSAELGEHRPRLLFLSACLTARVNTFLVSYTADLIERGFEAALGWGGSVKDAEATRFAGKLYHYLAKQDSLEFAVAQARFEMMNPLNRDEKPAKDWHLARLWLGHRGGGPLCSGHKARHKRWAVAGYKEFLGKTSVPVASKWEFTGRRRQIQAVLKAFRHNEYAGVLIHAIGRQGKSSLAARVAHRLPQLQTVVVFQEYDEDAILAAILEYASTPEVRDLISQYRRQSKGRHAGFMEFLCELLEGPFYERQERTPNRAARRPILLIIDDFERVLEDPPPGSKEKPRVKSKVQNAISAVIRAFDRAETDSRLLITSRTTFSLPHNERDLADRLLPIFLPPLNPHERRKQYENNLELAGDLPWLRNERLRERCIAVARGNPGLQKLLFDLCAASPEKSQAVLEEMEAYIAEGRAPSEEKLIEFLQNLALDRLLELLAPEEREVLRKMTLFRLPVPRTIVRRIAAEHTSDPDRTLERLVGLGVLEQFEDPVVPTRPAAAVNELIATRLPGLGKNEARQLAQALLEPLYQEWGGVSDSYNRPAWVDYELTRLALLTENAAILNHTARYAVNWLDSRQQPRQAAQLAVESLTLIREQGLEANISFLGKAAELCQLVGDISHALEYIREARQRIEMASDEAISLLDRASTYTRYGRILVLRGQPEEALREFKKAADLFQKGGFRREQAITLGDIARIKVQKGEVEEALKLHQQELKVYEALGDKRSAAVTLGDIARIKVQKGEVEEALKLHQQRLEVFEALGDKRSAAVTLGEIARIKVQKGEVEEALKLHQQELKVYEALGDLDSQAASLWDMAQIDLHKKDYQAAFEKLMRSYQINLQIGRLDGICFVGMDLGALLAAAGDREAARQVLQRSLQGFQKLGRQDLAERVKILLQQIDE